MNAHARQHKQLISEDFERDRLLIHLGSMHGAQPEEWDNYGLRPLREVHDEHHERSSSLMRVEDEHDEIVRLRAQAEIYRREIRELTVAQFADGDDEQIVRV